MTTIFNCADCRKAIKENSREHDDCWTNMEKDDDLWYCGDCKCDHMDEDDLPELVIPQAHNIGEFYTEEERRMIYEALKAKFEAMPDVAEEETADLPPSFKGACADCGQIETECSLKLVGGKVMCCDCIDPKDTEEEEEEESVCDDEQRSYGARGAPAPESDDDDDEEECDCCGENFEKVCLTIAEDAEGEEEKYCADCLLLKIDDGCVWQENGVWVC